MKKILAEYDARFCTACKTLCVPYEQGICCACDHPWETEVYDERDYPDKWIKCQVTISEAE